MKTRYIAFAALALLLSLAACNKDEPVNNDPDQTEDVEETKDQDYTYDASTNTYTVYTADGLLAWNEAAQDDLSLNCTLADDIDMTGINWTPIGSYRNQYTGAFEGGGHTITGLTVNKSGDHAGLIGTLDSGGKVQNLTLENENISGYDYVGGVVGINYGTVTDCSVSGSVSGSSYVAGVVGMNYNGTVTACSASSNAYAKMVYSGGVVGYNEIGTVTACYHVSGDIYGENYFIGGVVGNNNGTVTACYHASGSVYGAIWVGGVVGNNTGAVIACYWSDYEGDGIGDNDGFDETTKVDGTSVTWQNAVDGMNAALTTTDWQYEILEGNTLPTLKKN